MKRIARALLISLLLHWTILFLLGQHHLPEPQGRKEHATTIALVRLGKPSNGISLPSETSQISNNDFFQGSANLEPVIKKALPVKPVKKTIKEQKPVQKTTKPEPVRQKKTEQLKEPAVTKKEPEKTSSKSAALPAPGHGQDTEKVEQKEPSGNSSDLTDKQEGPVIIDAETAGVNRRVKPVYPRASRLRKEEGKVLLLVKIENGRVRETTVESSSGYPRLDSSAVEAIKKWTFSYHQKATVRIPVIFRLEDQ